MLAVNVTVLPWHMLVDPLAVMDAVGRAFTVTVTGDEVAVPEAPVTVTV